MTHWYLGDLKKSKILLATLKTGSSCRAHAKQREVYIQLNTPQVPWPISLTKLVFLRGPRQDSSHTGFATSKRHVRIKTVLWAWSPNLGSFLPMWHSSEPLRSLLSNKHAWCWGPAQQESFSHLKTELVKPTVPTY